jgi:VIT1/CCC1 family predicted Fe2+/Mn2+ transporter
MPNGAHPEKHFQGSEVVRDVVIGMSDGLTVPFALAAGLSGAVASTGLIVTAGVAEIAAGSIAMGLGGFLAGKTDVEHYATERARELRETREMPERENKEVADIFRAYGLKEGLVEDVVKAISSDREKWVDFMMRFELGLEAPDPRRAGQSALVIALSYIVGGFVPLAPYMIFASVRHALLASIAVTLVALALFGYIKGMFTAETPVRSAWQTTLVGMLAAVAAFGIARLIG